MIESLTWTKKLNLAHVTIDKNKRRN